MDLLKEFLDYKNSAGDISRETVEMYHSDIRDFQNYIKKDLEDVIEEDMVKYMEFMKSRYQANSIIRKCSSLKGFYLYLLKRNIIEELPIKNIVLPKSTGNRDNILEQWEILAVMDECKKDFKGSRDKIIIQILMETGLNITEILELKISQLEMENYENIHLLQENIKVPVSEKLKKNLLNFIELQKSYESEGEYLFKGLTRQSFRARFIKAAKKAGIEREVSPNMVKNTALKEIEQGEDSSLFENVRAQYFKIGIGDD